MSIKLNKAQSQAFKHIHVLDIESDDGQVTRAVDADYLKLPFNDGETLDRIDSIAAFMECMFMQFENHQSVLLDAEARDGLVNVMTTIRGLAALERLDQGNFKQDENGNVIRVGF